MLPESGFSYGGLNQRYSKHKRRLVRSLDPFADEPVDFGNTLKLDNWLLRRFCPGAVTCDMDPKWLRLFRQGTVISPACDLVTTFADKVRIADLVVTVMTPQLTEVWEQLQNTCKFYKITPHLRERALIRANMTLLANLDSMRQHLVQHGANLQHRGTVLSQLTHEAVPTSGELYKSLHYLSKNEIDSGLFLLYCDGYLFINLAEVQYGPHSKICLK